MTRVAADACNGADLPGWELEFTYVDGQCKAGAKPGTRTISSTASAAADVGDCEPRNPSWPTWISWVSWMRVLGRTPTIYCCDDGVGDDATWAGWRHEDGVKAFAAAGVAEPVWWVFNDNLSEPPAYAAAVQVAQNVAPGYDISIVSSYWPGIDPVPEEDPPMFAITGPNGEGWVVTTTGYRFGVASQADLAILVAGGVKPPNGQKVSANQLAQIPILPLATA